MNVESFKSIDSPVNETPISLDCKIDKNNEILLNAPKPIDYLNPEFTTLLPGQMTKVHPSAANNMLLGDAEWFSVDTSHVGHYLKDVFEN